MRDVRRVESLADYQVMATMAHQLARYHEEDFCPSGENLSADRAWFSACLTCDGDRPVGYAAWYKKYAPQNTLRVIEVENLFVDPLYRGRKIGQSLMAFVAQEALDLSAILAIGVRKGNDAALSFYKNIGFVMKDRHNLWQGRMERDVIHSFVRRHAG